MKLLFLQNDENWRKASKIEHIYKVYIFINVGFQATTEFQS